MIQRLLLSKSCVLNGSTPFTAEKFDWTPKMCCMQILRSSWNLFVQHGLSGLLNLRDWKKRFWLRAHANWRLCNWKLHKINPQSLFFRCASIFSIFYRQLDGQWVGSRVSSWRIFGACECELASYVFLSLSQVIWWNYIPLQITRFHQTIINNVSTVSSARYGLNNITSYIKKAGYPGDRIVCVVFHLHQTHKTFMFVLGCMHNLLL